MKKIAIALGIIQAFVAIGAIPAGLSMIFDPSGMGLGMTAEVLQQSPFRDFFIPGIFLFAINGVCHAYGSFLSFKKSSFAGMIGLMLGIYLILWICVQVYYTGLIHFLQPLFLVVGILEMLLGRAFMSKHSEQGSA